MNSIVLVWLQFALCAGLSRNRAGKILLTTLAAVTSLPELVTGLSAITVTTGPEVASRWDNCRRRLHLTFFQLAALKWTSNR